MGGEGSGRRGEWEQRGVGGEGSGGRGGWEAKGVGEKNWLAIINDQ